MFSNSSLLLLYSILISSDMLVFEYNFLYWSLILLKVWLFAFASINFFSILKIPDINHNSILKYTLRKNQLHLLSLEKIDNSSLNIKNKPAFCIEFQGNLYKKLEMLKLYKSVDFKKHYNDYYAFSTVSERLYFNTIASKIIENILNNMSLIVKDII